MIFDVKNLRMNLPRIEIVRELIIQVLQFSSLVN